MASLAHELVGAGILAALSIGVLACAELLRRLTSLPRETTRKFAHAGAGITLLAVPFAVHSHWTVLALATSFAAIMVVTHTTGMLASVHDVGRGVGGVLWYPFTGWAVYFVAYELLDGDWLLYAIPILVLAAADAFGALVGTSYGRHRYEVMHGHFRSVEGSIAFFVMAFFCVHVPLLLHQPFATDRTETLLISLIVALLAAGLETISVYGLDNLLVPFGVLFILDRAVELTVGELLVHYLLLFAVGVVAMLVARHKPTTGGGIVMYALSAYSVGALGGAAWLGPFLGMSLVFVAYERLTPVRHDHTRSRYALGTAVAGLAVPVLIAVTHDLVASDQTRHALYVAYLAALATDAAVLAFMLPQNRTFRWSGLARRVRTESRWQYRVTPGKLVFALAGAAVPVLLQPAGLPAVNDIAIALVWGLGGLGAFVLVAALPRAHYACASCERITLRGLYCCHDERLGDRSSEPVLAITFRKVYLLANAGAALAVLALLTSR